MVSKAAAQAGVARILGGRDPGAGILGKEAGKWGSGVEKPLYCLIAFSGEEHTAPQSSLLHLWQYIKGVKWGENYILTVDFIVEGELNFLKHIGKVKRRRTAGLRRNK